VVYLYSAILERAPKWSKRWWQFVPVGRRGGAGTAGRGWLVDSRLACGSGGDEHRVGGGGDGAGRGTRSPAPGMGGPSHGRAAAPGGADRGAAGA
jgi:hypothetical protein